MTWSLVLLMAGVSTVAIDLPAEAPPELTARVVESCNAALGAPRCEAARPEGNDTSLLAVVRFEGAKLEIRLLRADADRSEVDRRSLAFSEGDTAADRFIAAGLMVAALTAARQETPPPVPATEPALIDATTLEPPPVRPPPLHLGLDAALALGPGLSLRHPRWGGVLGAWWMAHAPRLGVRAAASYLTAASPVRLSWASFSLGAVTRLTPWHSRIDVMLAAEAMVQRAAATAEQEGVQQSTSVVRWGARLAARLGMDLGGPVRPWLEAELSLLRPGFEVRLENERLGAADALGFGAAVGVTIVPFE